MPKKTDEVKAQNAEEKRQKQLARRKQNEAKSRKKKQRSNKGYAKQAGLWSEAASTAPEESALTEGTDLKK